MNSYIKPGVDWCGAESQMPQTEQYCSQSQQSTIVIESSGEMDAVLKGDDVEKWSADTSLLTTIAD